MTPDTPWRNVATDPPPDELVVDTLGENGTHQPLKRSGRLWFFPDGSMYVYYTPIKWRPA